MDLFAAFQDYISTQKLFSSSDRLLLAVSGGMDSVVLCRLCDRAGLDFVIAHANFQLRGDESIRDEVFVRQLAAEYGREVFVKAFDTIAYAEAHNVSVQVAARELRYAWFDLLLSERGLRYLLTAHHLDDNIETLLMNFMKGTGIAGLRGMLPRQGGVVRPLLFAGRADIHRYADEQDLSWVEDSSNETDHYTRNYFRHRVIPIIGEVYPAVQRNLADNLLRFRDIELIYREAIDAQKRKLLEYKGGEVHIPVLKLLRATALDTLLYEIAAPYGFSAHQAAELKDLLQSGSGRYMVSATHRILRNRKWLIISPLQTTGAAIIPVGEEDTETGYAQGVLRFRKLDAGGVGDLDQGARVALLDAGEVRYPLLLRPWKTGDYFYPLGMRKKKKLARFFIDNKLSLADKEKVWVLEADKRIIWVIGWRIDDRFRVGPRTRRVLKIEWGPSGSEGPERGGA
jgi:tRNA(Ile)-lysidine synthase